MCEKITKSIQKMVHNQRVKNLLEKKVDPDDPYASRNYAFNFFPISTYS